MDNIPQDLIEAAEKLHRYFAVKNIKQWRLGHVQNAAGRPQWVYVHDGSGRKPAINTPVVVLFRVRKAGRIVGVTGVCCVVEDIFNPGTQEWVRLDSENNKAQPYAWLDFGPIAETWDDQFLHNLAKLGEIPL